MDISGKYVKAMPETRGESQRGPWVRGGFVIETDDVYPRQVAFTLFGEDRLAMIKDLQPGALVVVTFSPESREYNERWYTDLRCIRVSAAAAAPSPVSVASAAAPAQPHAAAAAPSFATPPTMAQDTDDDLPF
ncbi:MAG: DUF3127 domain-containing protein [Bacteroidales bacterium]|nr:DUF3127 domain-containing protein [Bacteroidales bacterium]